MRTAERRHGRWLVCRSWLRFTRNSRCRARASPGSRLSRSRCGTRSTSRARGLGTTRGRGVWWSGRDTSYTSNSSNPSSHALDVSNPVNKKVPRIRYLPITSRTRLHPPRRTERKGPFRGLEHAGHRAPRLVGRGRRVPDVASALPRASRGSPGARSTWPPPLSSRLRFRSRARALGRRRDGPPPRCVRPRVRGRRHLHGALLRGAERGLRRGIPAGQRHPDHIRGGPHRRPRHLALPVHPQRPPAHHRVHRRVRGAQNRRGERRPGGRDGDTTRRAGRGGGKSKSRCAGSQRVRVRRGPRVHARAPRRRRRDRGQGVRAGRRRRQRVPPGRHIHPRGGDGFKPAGGDRRRLPVIRSRLRRAETEFAAGGVRVPGRSGVRARRVAVQHAGARDAVGVRVADG